MTSRALVVDTHRSADLADRFCMEQSGDIALNAHKFHHPAQFKEAEQPEESVSPCGETDECASWRNTEK